MKSLLLFAVFITSAICASAQKVYFIYLQSDNSNPFYVKMNDRIYSSAASGYLVLSNLIDSTYSFSIGFPSSQSESRFTIKLGAKDKGFLIKRFESGLGLFDLQTLTITNEQKDTSPKNISYIRRNDDFSFLLSKAANDTSLLYAVVSTNVESEVMQEPQPGAEDSKSKTEGTTLVKNSTAVDLTNTELVSGTKREDTIATVQLNSELKKEDSVTALSTNETMQRDSIVSGIITEGPKQISSDSLVSKGLDNPANSTREQVMTPDSAGAVFKKSRIKKYSESSTSEGFGLIFYDVYEGGQDTIRLLIPNPPVLFKQSSEDDSLELQKRTARVEELRKDTMQQTPIVVSIKNNSSGKTPCKAIASDNDFFKLRKNMAAENTDEAMVAEAKKVFKNKCFTSEQIKNLGALFLTSSGKYQFFDAAYLHVSDQENFSSLESEIKDDYYLKRFKALIGE